MIAWQKGVEFGDRAFDVAERLPQRLQFSFGEQLRRAALSITNNSPKAAVAGPDILRCGEGIRVRSDKRPRDPATP
jgi:hypothetical protein